MGFKAGALRANPTILEPYMKVEVIVPEEYMGDVIGDLNSRRGRIEGMEARNGAQVINAFVPLSEMFGYSTDLRSKTQGRGNYSMLNQCPVRRVVWQFAVHYPRRLQLVN